MDHGNGEIAILLVDDNERGIEKFSVEFRVSNKLNSTLDVEHILDTLAQRASRVVNNGGGFAGLWAADGMVAHKHQKKMEKRSTMGIPGNLVKGFLGEGTTL